MPKRTTTTESKQIPKRKRNGLINWEALLDGYGSKHVTSHLGKSGLLDIVDKMTQDARWNTMTIWYTTSFIDPGIFSKSLQAQVDFIESLQALDFNKLQKNEEKSEWQNGYLHYLMGIQNIGRTQIGGAIDELGKAYACWLEVRNKDQLIDLNIILAGIKAGLGKFDEARYHCDHAINLISKKKNDHRLSIALFVYANILQSNGNYSGARETYDKAIKVINDASNLEASPYLLLGVGENLQKYIDANRDLSSQEKIVSLLSASKNLNNAIRQLRAAGNWHLLLRGYILSSRIYRGLMSLTTSPSKKAMYAERSIKSANHAINIADQYSLILPRAKALMEVALIHFSLEDYKKVQTILKRVRKSVQEVYKKSVGESDHHSYWLLLSQIERILAGIEFGKWQFASRYQRDSARNFRHRFVRHINLSFRYINMSSSRFFDKYILIRQFYEMMKQVSYVDLRDIMNKIEFGESNAGYYRSMMEPLIFDKVLSDDNR